MSFVARIAFYPTLFYNAVMSKFTSRNWYDRIDETVVLGALPFRQMTYELLEMGVKGVITMNEDFELKLCNTSEEWGSFGVRHLHLSTVDLIAAPSQEKIERGMDFIDEIKQLNGSVYVHCKAGRTRSSTIVACYLMKYKGFDPETAVEFIKEKRPHIILRKPQWDAIRSFYRSIS